MTEYQLLPGLSDDERAALRESIRTTGVKVPIEFDEHGAVLDGHHRLAICQELGITDYPRVVRVGLTEEQKIAHVLSLNLDRRHLTREERREVIASMLRAHPEWSDSRTAHMTKTTDKTVGAVRRDLEATSEIPKLERLVGQDGKERPAQMPARKPVAVYNPSTRDWAALTQSDAVADKLTSGVARTVAEARRQTIVEQAREAVWPDGKYRVIYADPPWSYGNTQPEYHPSPQDHYPTMSLEAICALPVKALALDDAVLFLWVTSPILEEAFAVVRAWGFAYKTSFVWDKVAHNMGHYNSVRHELLLVCVRGSCQPDVRRLFDSVVTEERTEHSRKPEVFRQMIETLYTHGPYLELFAREQREGWTSHGNELG